MTIFKIAVKPVFLVYEFLGNHYEIDYDGNRITYDRKVLAVSAVRALGL